MTVPNHCPEDFLPLHWPDDVLISGPTKSFRYINQSTGRTTSFYWIFVLWLQYPLWVLTIRFFGSTILKRLYYKKVIFLFLYFYNDYKEILLYMLLRLLNRIYLTTLDIKPENFNYNKNDIISHVMIHFTCSILPCFFVGFLLGLKILVLK